jgi:hypothetical protein
LTASGIYIKNFVRSDNKLSVWVFSAQFNRCS